MKPAALYFSLLVAVLADKPVSCVQCRVPSQSDINAVPFHPISRDSKDDQFLISLKRRAQTAVSKSEMIRPSIANQQSTKVDTFTKRLIARSIIPPKKVPLSLSRRSPMQAPWPSISTVKQKVAEIERHTQEMEAARQAQALQRPDRARTPARTRPIRQVAPPGPSSAGPSSPQPLSPGSPSSRISQPMPLPRARTSPPRIPTIGAALSRTSSPRTSPARTSPPRAATPGSSLPGSSLPGSSSPRTSPPRAATPGTSITGSSLPGIPLPGIATPAILLPGISTPRASSPRASSPRVSLTGISTLEASLPEILTPRPSSPKASSPKASSPQATSPKASSPKASSPKASSPRTSPPRNSSPRASTTTASGSDTPKLHRTPSTESVESYKSIQSSSSNGAEGQSAQGQPVQSQIMQKESARQQSAPPPTPQQTIAQQQSAPQSITQERSMTRSRSLPLVPNLKSGQRVPGELSASQPPSPRRREREIPPTLAPQQAPLRRVTVADSPSEMILDNQRPRGERPNPRSSLPLRSALKGSNNNLAGMVSRPIIPLPRENPLSSSGVPITGPVLQGTSSDPQRSPTQASRSNTAGTTSQVTQSAPADDRHEPVGSSFAAPRVQAATPHSATGPAAGRTSASRNSPQNPNMRNGQRRPREPMTTSLSRGLGDISIENERHPGKLWTTGVGTLLSGGIVGGIMTGINYHSANSIAGGTLAGSCVGMTGFVGACYYWKNARTTVEREQIPPEVRQNRGQEAAASMVPRIARQSYNYWAGRSNRGGAQNRGTNHNQNPNNAGAPSGAAAPNDGPATNNTPATNNGPIPNNIQNQGPPSSATESRVPANAVHPDPNHPENLVRRYLADFSEGYE